MIRKYKILIYISLISITSSCQKNQGYNCYLNIQSIHEEYDYDNLNKEWLEESLIKIKSLDSLLKKEPNNIEKLIDIQNDQDDVILNEKSVLLKKGYGGGYLGMFCDIVLSQNKPISYRLQISRKNVLLFKKYNIDVTDLFNEIDDFGDYYFYTYNIETVSKPYTNIEGFENINDKVKFYMSPYSGTRYGCRGGYGNVIQNNRCAFKQIENDLTTKDIFYIFHSINPASRLTVIEYYYRHKNKFSKEEQKKIEPIIEDIFKEIGDEIEILDGDFVTRINPRDAVKKLVKHKCI